MEYSVTVRSSPCWVSNVRSVLAFVALAILLTACGAPVGVDGEIVGIVTEVTGDLSGVESFVVLDPNGDSHKFTPADGMTVVGGPPFHLRDHLLSGEAVRVIYHEGTGGELIAEDVLHG